MARYFMQLRGGAEDVLDPDGSEFATLAALREAVLFTARDLIASDVRLGLMDLRLRIDAEDEDGVIVHTLRLKHAVNIVTGVLPAASCATAKPRDYSIARAE